MEINTPKWNLEKCKWRLKKFEREVGEDENWEVFVRKEWESINFILMGK
jgi:hypothetical protein